MPANDKAMMKLVNDYKDVASDESEEVEVKAPTVSKKVADAQIR